MNSFPYIFLKKGHEEKQLLFFFASFSVLITRRTVGKPVFHCFIRSSFQLSAFSFQLSAFSVQLQLHSTRKWWKTAHGQCQKKTIRARTRACQNWVRQCTITSLGHICPRSIWGRCICMTVGISKLNVATSTSCRPRRLWWPRHRKTHQLPPIDTSPYWSATAYCMGLPQFSVLVLHL